MKKQMITAITVLVLTVAFSNTATAGAARRHTAEGFMLGAGVTLLGTAIIHGMSRQEPVVIHHHDSPRHRSDDRDRDDDRGHWESRRTWVAPITETRWNPGHRHGRWVKGHYEQFTVSEGYWQTERVWVSSCRR